MVNLYRTWSKNIENKDPLLAVFLQNKPPTKSFMSSYVGYVYPESGKSCWVLVAHGFRWNIISGHTDVDFCPCCIKFIRRDAEGWKVVEPEA